MDNLDMERLVDAVTKEIMKRLNTGTKRVLVLGGGKDCEIASLLSGAFSVDCKDSLDNAAAYDYVVLPSSVLGGDGGKAAATRHEPPAGEALDLTGKRLIHERELREKCTGGASCVRVDKKAIITSLAADYIKSRKLTVLRVD